MKRVPPNYFAGMVDDRYHTLLTEMGGTDHSSMNKRKEIFISVNVNDVILITNNLTMNL